MSRKVWTQSLIITPCGQVRGGHLAYTYHSSTGEAFYSGEIILRPFIFLKSYEFDGILKIPKDLVRSSSLVRNREIVFGDLKVIVEWVSAGLGEVTLEFAGALPGTGVGLLDLTDEVAKLDHLSWDGVIKKPTIFGAGMVHLNVVPIVD